MIERNIGELQRLMNTVDGRDFIYNFAMECCGVDYMIGVPSAKKDEYLSGMQKPAIDLFNMLVYYCYDNFKLMLSEQEQRRKANG